MSGVYYWTGALVIWGASLAIAALAFYLIVWRLVGYLVGWFRLCRIVGKTPWKWFMFRWAWKHMIRMEDGWYQEHEEGRVPLYGFAKIKEPRYVG